MEKEKQEILMAMGMLLASLQITEKVIKILIIIILPEDGIALNIDRLLSQEKKYQRAMLGTLLRELRKRADIDPKFDNILSEFLDMRNDFIHDLARVNGFDLNTKEGRLVAAKFINKLSLYNEIIVKVLFGLGRAWQKQNGITFPEIAEYDFENHDFIKEVDSKYIPLINKIFYKLRD